MLFDNRWNQHTCTSLTLLPFGLWAPDVTKPDLLYNIIALAIGDQVSTSRIFVKFLISGNFQAVIF